jgi:uncharacterized protein (DUF849 family)
VSVSETPALPKTPERVLLDARAAAELLVNETFVDVMGEVETRCLRVLEDPDKGDDEVSEARHTLRALREVEWEIRRRITAGMLETDKMARRAKRGATLTERIAMAVGLRSRRE